VGPAVGPGQAAIGSLDPGPGSWTDPADPGHADPVQILDMCRSWTGSDCWILDSQNWCRSWTGSDLPAAISRQRSPGWVPRVGPGQAAIGSLDPGPGSWTDPADPGHADPGQAATAGSWTARTDGSWTGRTGDRQDCACWILDRRGQAGSRTGSDGLDPGQARTGWIPDRQRSPGSDLPPTTLGRDEGGKPDRIHAGHVSVFDTCLSSTRLFDTCLSSTRHTCLSSIRLMVVDTHQCGPAVLFGAALVDIARCGSSP